MFLIVSSAVNLAKRYGPDGTSRLRERMETLHQDLAPQAGQVAVVFPDDAASISRYRLKPIAMTSSAGIAQALWALYDALGFSVKDALLLIGGNDVIPFADLANPAAGGIDSDVTVLSDNPYGFSSRRAAQAFQSGSVPDFAVGRLPDFEPANLEGFLALLDLLAQPREPRTGTFAVVNEAWLGATEKVLDGYGTIRTTPPWSASNAEWKSQSAQLLYFNLHGFSDVPVWRGFDNASGNWRDSISPSDVVQEAVSSAIVFAENCYGGFVNGRSPKNSVALSMLASGARAFIGSTSMAYGSFMQQPEAPVEADVLGGDFVRHIRAGEPAGYALAIARREFSGATSPEGWDADRQKTISEFVLYGNPLARL